MSASLSQGRRNIAANPLTGAVVLFMFDSGDVAVVGDSIRIDKTSWQNFPALSRTPGTFHRSLSL
jgi:hypothetical protein